MKLSLLTLLSLLFSASFAYSQFDQEAKEETKTIEETVDKAINKVEQFVASLEFEEFFEKDVPEFIEEIKPTKEEIENFEAKIQEGINCIKDLDTSILDEIVEDVEDGVDEIKEEIEEEIEDYKKSKRKTSKI